MPSKERNSTLQQPPILSEETVALVKSNNSAPNLKSKDNFEFKVPLPFRKPQQLIVDPQLERQRQRAEFLQQRA